MKINKIILPAAAFFFGIAQAQQTAFFQDKNAYKANLAGQLYDNKINGAARHLFGEQLYYNHALDAMAEEASSYYENLLNIVLEKNHAEKGLEKFLEDYPNSVFYKQSDPLLADYYLGKKDFKSALGILRKTDINSLSGKDRTNYMMKLGYAEFMTGDSEGAISALENVYKNDLGAGKESVAYMLGHLNYAKGNLNKAFEYFDSIKNNEKYALIIRPYYVQLFYNQKNYDQAISEGNALLSSGISDKYKAEVHKIIGESYFMKGNYSAALPHLKIYIDEQQNPGEKDLYEMGFVSAKNQDYSAAVSYYNQLTNSQSGLAQNAYYQLGNAYLLTGKKQEALSAFRSSYQMDYDSEVQKLAHAQYAKIGYEIGNPFEAPAMVIQDYLKKYPNASNRQEMRNLLVKTYLYSGNYRETLDAIDQSEKTAETEKISQEVAFLLGTEEFNKGNYDEAEKFFSRSLKSGENMEFKNRAAYWLAQLDYQKNNYPAAIEVYEKLKNSSLIFPEKQQISYDLGYAYFKNKNFEKAQQNFIEYLKKPNPEFADDASLRLADTYYAQNKLSEAIAIYNKIENAGDYVLFQKALLQGFKGDTAAKISGLRSLISKFPESDYADDANFEIATAYAAQEDFGLSNSYLEKVISESEDSDLLANAKIYHAQNLLELGRTDESVAEFRRLATVYLGSAFAQKIVQAAKPSFIKNGDIAAYQDFAKSLNISLGRSEVNEIYLAQAKNYYSDKQYGKAIPLYEKYLSQNPATENAFQGTYELGESYYQSKNSSKALLVFQELADLQNDYQEDALVRISQILMADGKLSEAKPHLEKLLNSPSSAVKNFAETSLMKIYAGEKDYAVAEKLADQVIANAKNPAAVLENAMAIKARALMNAGKDKEARKFYSALEKSANSEIAAEALYAKAYYLNKDKVFKASNETIFKLANNYSSEEYWGAKALLVMAKNYYGMKDKYQATYTLDQIIANYQEFPEIVEEAKIFKNKIK